MSGKTQSAQDGGERKVRRAYRDPTADAAIANIMREERKKRKSAEMKTTASHNRNGSGGSWHGGK